MEYELVNGKIYYTEEMSIEQVYDALISAEGRIEQLEAELEPRSRLRHLTTGEMANIETKCAVNPSKFAAPAIVDYLRELWSES